MKVAVAVRDDGQLDQRWGRAHRVAVADVGADGTLGWQEHEVRWDVLHDEGTEGSHHARVARFLLDHGVEAVAVNHVGAGMERMLATMGIRLVTGLSGPARDAARKAAAGT